MLCKLLFSITIISPLSTSLKNLAPIISKAQVSEAKTYEFFNLPITKGLIPKGSLTPIIYFVLTSLKHNHLEFEKLHQ